MSDDELRLIMVELINHLDDWAYDMFPEGDYSAKWSQLKAWAKKTKSEYKEESDYDTP